MNDYPLCSCQGLYGLLDEIFPGLDEHLNRDMEVLGPNVRRNE